MGSVMSRGRVVVLVAMRMVTVIVMMPLLLMMIVMIIMMMKFVIGTTPMTCISDDCSLSEAEAHIE